MNRYTNRAWNDARPEPPVARARSPRLIVWFSAIVMLIAYEVPGMAQGGGGEQYFASFGGYDLPLRLQERLSKEEAEALGTYYIARSDASGRLKEVQKVHHGETFFVHEYFYDADGVLLEARVTNKDGKISTLRRNSEGKLVED